MKTRRQAIALCVLVLSAGVPLRAQGKDWTVERLPWEGPAADRRVVVIDNPHGDVRCRPAPGADLSLTAIVQRHRADPYAAELRVIEGEALRIEPVWIDAEEGVGGEYVEGMERRRVDLMVLVPAGPDLEIRTGDGLLEVKGTTNEVRATSGAGAIVISSSGTPVATTATGSLDVTLRGTDWRGPVRLETTTGALTLWLPAGTDAAVEASTEGILSTDFTIEVTRDADGRRKSARAVLGRGSRRVTMTSVKGDVRLFRLPGR